MQDDAVAAVRRFNRIVTQRIGALDEQYLDRARPLGASRVLWEVADPGRDVRTLRARLGLDSGYLSRILRRLEAERLVEVRPDRADGRARVVHLTRAGRAERAELDRRSDDLARALLDPLDEPRRTRLLEAMATVERLLTAGLVSVRVEHPDGAAARTCLRAFFAELDSRFEAGFDPAASTSATTAELTEPAGLLLVAWLGEEPVGCGAVKLPRAGLPGARGPRRRRDRPEPAVLKRMWVAPHVRGLGVGRRLLAELEARARGAGATTARLETNRRLTEAIGLYRSCGYVEVAAFNDEPYAHHWFEKRLAAP